MLLACTQDETNSDLVTHLIAQGTGREWSLDMCLTNYKIDMLRVAPHVHHRVAYTLPRQRADGAGPSA